MPSSPKYSASNIVFWPTKGSLQPKCLYRVLNTDGYEHSIIDSYSHSAKFTPEFGIPILDEYSNPLKSFPLPGRSYSKYFVKIFTNYDKFIYLVMNNYIIDFFIQNRPN